MQIFLENRENYLALFFNQVLAYGARGTFKERIEVIITYNFTDNVNFPEKLRKYFEISFW